MAEDDKPRGEPAVKAKLPNAKNIRSPEFTPHGISGGGSSQRRAPRPSGLTAAKAKKRRRASIAGTVAVVLVIVGGTAYLTTRPGKIFGPTPQIKVSGKFGEAPKVTIPKNRAPSKTFSVDEAIKGTGPKLANGDTALVKFAFYQWAPKTGGNGKSSTNKELNSSFKATDATKKVLPMTVGKTELKGLDKGLVGHSAGSRLVLTLPPADGFGEQGQQMGLGNNDSVVFVVDVLSAYPKGAAANGTDTKFSDKNLPKVDAPTGGNAPKITIPKGVDAPDKLQIKTLAQGNGAALAKGDQAVVQYVGAIWRDGKVFDESWKKGAPAVFPVGTGGTVPGFDKGLTGAKIGSRVMLVLPPKEGYGKTGNPEAGIKGTDTLVFVVDILGTVPK
ncbi:FKBP-type peptidyl-prolyl cis-trans isomerase [Actinomadura barringtoniae]|uniref:peptidylprolyl isomerase n=1 Tax=Actinomadura barringtoniae TaxID=1427535 RepID=A0A939PCI5_9ACTN|nr:FKBP-type peptidyl-prolyl cis-trans isomerase [Actinomadura barringtoniae]MBO2445966.1 FKBP-type peptidyl-prolyl cis-trans isomerase [Actinomadura barringtoniae]